VIPIRLGDDGDFEILRTALRGAGFNEAEIARRFGLQKIADFEEDTARPQIEPFEEAAAGILTRLFVEGGYAPEDVTRSHLGNAAVDAMDRLGLIARDEDEPGTVEATVALYETVGVCTISDRWNTPDRTPFIAFPDIVYPCIVSNAQRFLAHMPSEPCDDFLDLCTGTGVAALAAAKGFAKRAYGYDIAERSALFAEFNKRLNGLTNVTFGCSDLYDAVDGVMFDRIVAHPPYVPVLRPKYVYHDGGTDGESIIRRIIQGLPRYLKPGGVYYMLAMGSDRLDAPLERRIREWLGDAGADFDVALSPEKSMAPEEFAKTASLKSHTPQDDMTKWTEMFETLRVSHLVYGVVMIQRREQPRNVFTVRRQLGPKTSGIDICSMLKQETLLAGPTAVDKILNSRARANKDTELHVRHALTGDGWTVQEYKLQTSHPFSMDARTDAWGPYLIGICDGAKTLRQCFQELKEQEVFPEQADPAEFARAVAVLVSGGFIFLD
jgi:SAM-dependent methyltransferase